ncbi:MAG: hypothetical protein CMJ45_05645 [Planctomyces sp.]|nr:hypothetical protein [Planctomyces sp.]
MRIILSGSRKFTDASCLDRAVTLSGFDVTFVLSDGYRPVRGWARRHNLQFQKLKNPKTPFLTADGLIVVLGDQDENDQARQLCRKARDCEQHRLIFQYDPDFEIPRIKDLQAALRENDQPARSGVERLGGLREFLSLTERRLAAAWLADCVATAVEVLPDGDQLSADPELAGILVEALNDFLNDLSLVDGLPTEIPFGYLETLLIQAMLRPDTAVVKRINRVRARTWSISQLSRFRVYRRAEATLDHVLQEKLDPDCLHDTISKQICSAHEKLMTDADFGNRPPEKVLHYVCHLTWLNRRYRRTKDAVRKRAEEELVDDLKADSPELHHEDLHEEMQRCWSELDAGDQLVLELYHDHGLTQHQVAENLNIDGPTPDARRQQARRLYISAKKRFRELLHSARLPVETWSRFKWIWLDPLEGDS